MSTTSRGYPLYGLTDSADIAAKLNAISQAASDDWATKPVTDWNTATANGFYSGAGAANGPTASGAYMGLVVTGGGGDVVQTVWRYGTANPVLYEQWHRARLVSGTWGAWVRQIGQSSGVVTSASGYETANGVTPNVVNFNGRAMCGGQIQKHTGTFPASADTIIGTVPAGFRPSSQYQTECQLSGNSAALSVRAFIEPTGQLHIVTGASVPAYVSLSGFPAYLIGN